MRGRTASEELEANFADANNSLSDHGEYVEQLRLQVIGEINSEKRLRKAIVVSKILLWIGGFAVLILAWAASAGP